MAFAPNRMQVTCPNCGTPAVARVYTIVNAQEQPELKEALLAGELNLYQCPGCGTVGGLQSPLVYHDPAKELLLVFIPMGLNLPAHQEDQFIAQATKAIIEHTPAEQRKGYMLRPPARAISMQGLVESVLEADGVSREELQRQADQVRLLRQASELANDDTKLRAALTEQKHLLDTQLIRLINAALESAANHQDEASVQRYNTLRERVIELGGFDPNEVPSLGMQGVYEQLLEALRHAPAEARESLVVGNRSLLDYGFFLFLSQQIDAAAESEKRELSLLRDDLLSLTDEIDAEAKEVMGRASQKLQDILRSPNPEETIRERLDELDEAFLMILQANMEAAQQQGRQDILQRLATIYQMTVVMLQEQARPELRLVNQLLQVESAEARKPLIEEALRTYPPAEFLEIVQMIVANAESQQLHPELVQRLQQIISEVQVAMGGTPSAAAPKPRSSLIVTPEDERRQAGGDAPSIIIPGRF